MESNTTALIIGATGLVGGECLNQLLNSGAYTTVTALTRKPLPFKHQFLKNIVVDFDKPEKYSADINATHVYCCTGSTIAKAGSKEAFMKVDYDLPLQVAQIAKANGASKFILISSLGANAKSAIFYSRVKGELEQALEKLGFNALIIFRPSLLLGDRKEKRGGEEIGRFVSEKFGFLFNGPLKKYRGMPARTLAKAMLKAGLENTKGVRIIENAEIFAFGAKD